MGERIVLSCNREIFVLLCLEFTYGFGVRPKPVIFPPADIGTTGLNEHLRKTQCIPVDISSVFLDLGKNSCFSFVHSNIIMQ